MKILLSGGGTMGPVSPLLAIAEALKDQHPDVELFWLGTKDGPVRPVVEKQGIKFKAIAAGKLRRYFDLENLIDPFKIIGGFFQSIGVISKFKPDIILTAGGFVAVPVVWAGKLFGKPSLVHQQDIRPGLANKLMAPFAKVITVTFEKSAKDFKGKNVEVTGNPVRPEILKANKELATRTFNLGSDLPTLLVLGGGTGSKQLNKLIGDTITDLVEFCNVIHITGGRGQVLFNHPRYHQAEFLIDEMPSVLAVADLVVSRAGLSIITELVTLGKASILIPMQKTHQVDNAIEFERQNAALVINQHPISPDGFVESIKSLLENEVELNTYRKNIKQMMPLDGTDNIVNVINKLLSKK